MKALLGIGLPVLLLVVLAAAIWFVESRLVAAFGISQTTFFRATIYIFYTAAVAALPLGDRSPNPILGGLYVISGVAFMFLIYLTFAFLAVRLAEVFWSIPLRSSAISAVAVAGAVTTLGILWARTFQINEVEIKISGLAKPVTIMHMPDIHIGHHRGRDYLKRIVDETNKRNPDLISINGDLLDAATAFIPGVLDPLSEFKAPAFYTGGNHENYVNPQMAEAIVSKLGVRVLRNEIVETKGLQLIGLIYMKADDETFDLHPSDVKDSVKSAMESLAPKTALPRILLHHSPVGAKYAEARGVDLMLAGHTHAGQVFPGTLISKLVFQFNRGLYSLGKMQIFVSQGAGTFLLPGRVGSSNEINFIKLVP